MHLLFYIMYIYKCQWYLRTNTITMFFVFTTIIIINVL